MTASGPAPFPPVKYHVADGEIERTIERSNVINDYGEE